MNGFLSESDLWQCKYASAGEDEYGITVPWCTISDMSCESILRYADEACKYTKHVDDFERLEKEGAE